MCRLFWVYWSSFIRTLGSCKSFCKVFNFFYEATVIFSSSFHVTIHIAFHQLAPIFDKIQKACINENGACKYMGYGMKKIYDKNWVDVLKIRWSFITMYPHDIIFAK